jgi:hypothetical protein
VKDKTSMSRFFDYCIDLGFEFNDLCRDQSEWSQKTFGSDSERGPLGALKHLEKESIEAQKAIGTDDLTMELADCLLLTLDAARRGGVKPLSLIRAAQRKMQINKERTWPTPLPDEPVEHL